MSFPSIIFKKNSDEVKKRHYDLVEQKLASLERYIGNETDVKCEVEFEKINSHQSGDIYRMEVNFWLAGNLYRAEATKDSFETAIDVVRTELDRELNKENEKRQTLARKGGREIKDAVRFGEKI